MTDSNLSFNNLSSSTLRNSFQFSMDTPTLKRKRLSTDSVVTPPSKRVIDASSSSPWEINRTKIELTEARSQICLLENQIKQLHSIRKELETLFQNEKQTMSTQRQRDILTIQEYETRITLLRKRESDCKEELTTVKHELRTSKLESDKKIDQLQQVIYNLKESLHDERSNEHNTSFTLSNELMNLESALKLSQEEVKSQQKLISDLQAQLTTKVLTENDVELKKQEVQKLQSRVNELEFERDTFLEQQEINKKMKENYPSISGLQRDLEKLQSENRHLREAIRNKLILEEQVHDLQNRLELLKNVSDEKLEFEIKAKYMEKQIDKWRVLGELCGIDADTDAEQIEQIRREIERLQNREITLFSLTKSLEQQANTHLRECNSAKFELEQINKQLTEAESNKKMTQNILHRLQKKLILITRERDCYKSQLDSYEKELTITETTHSAQQNWQKEREKFENIIGNYKEYVARLEKDLEGFSGTDAGSTLIPVKMDQMKRLQSEVDKLRNEKEDLVRQRNDLQDKYEKLVKANEEKQSNAGKVLHFVNNPFNEAVKNRENEVTQLRTKVLFLKRKIKDLEEGLSNASQIAEQHKLNDTSFAVNAQEVQKLRDELDAFGRKHQRLKDVFRATSQEFRDVVYMLFGYKVDRKSKEIYQLIHMYSDSPDDYLSFKIDENHVLNLLETEFAATLGDLVDVHLRDRDSIPAFLSALTLELLKKANSKEVTDANME